MTEGWRSYLEGMRIRFQPSIILQFHHAFKTGSCTWYDNKMGLFVDWGQVEFCWGSGALPHARFGLQPSGNFWLEMVEFFPQDILKKRATFNIQPTFCVFSDWRKISFFILNSDTWSERGERRMFFSPSIFWGKKRKSIPPTFVPHILDFVKATSNKKLSLWIWPQGLEIFPGIKIDCHVYVTAIKAWR